LYLGGSHVKKQLTYRGQILFVLSQVSKQVLLDELLCTEILKFRSVHWLDIRLASTKISYRRSFLRISYSSSGKAFDFLNNSKYSRSLSSTKA